MLVGRILKVTIGFTILKRRQNMMALSYFLKVILQSIAYFRKKLKVLQG